MKEKKYTKVLNRVVNGMAFNKSYLRFEDIKDKKVCEHILKKKYVFKDIIGRYYITDTGKRYLGLLPRVNAKNPIKKLTEKKARKNVIRTKPITEERIKFIKENPNQKSKFYRRELDITDSGFHSLVADNKCIIKSGKYGSYTYSVK